MTATPPPRADARRNREAVVAAAIRVLSADPDASMREIADASGVTRTTVYRHFPGREELVRAIFEHVRDRFVARAEEVLSEGGPAPDVLRRLALALVEESAPYGFLLPYREEAEAVFEPGVARPEDPVHAWMDAARANGELRDDVPLAWQVTMVQAAVGAAAEQIARGRVAVGEAGRLLGASLVALLVP